MIPSFQSTGGPQVPAKTNRLAMLSFMLAALTFSFFCVGLAPIPLTAWVCYPAAMLLGCAALLTGFRAVRQVRASGEKGRFLAWAGIWAGLLTMLAVLCATSLSLVFLYYGAQTINNLWPQLKP